MSVPRRPLQSGFQPTESRDPRLQDLGRHPHLALRLVERAGEHLGLDGQVLDLEGAHETADAIAAKDAEQVVLQAQKVAGATGVALPAGVPGLGARRGVGWRSRPCKLACTYYSRILPKIGALV